MAGAHVPRYQQPSLTTHQVMGERHMSAAQAIFAGILINAVFFFLACISSGWKPSRLILGEDGIPSTSKFQFFAWTAAILFAYVTIFCFHCHAAGFTVLTDVPVNLLLAMGISATSAVGAKAIAVSSAAQPAPVPVPAPGPDPLVAQPPAPPPPVLGGILQDDDGTPDLSKIQLIMWTIIGIGVFFSGVGHALATGVRQIPDIDRTLMILMGLGHSAYLGKKIADAQN